MWSVEWMTLTAESTCFRFLLFLRAHSNSKTLQKVWTDFGRSKQSLRVFNVVAFSGINSRMLWRWVGRQEKPQHRPNDPERSCNTCSFLSNSSSSCFTQAEFKKLKKRCLLFPALLYDIPSSCFLIILLRQKRRELTEEVKDRVPVDILTQKSRYRHC